MNEKEPFNPIEIPNIALTLALEVLDQPAVPLPPSGTHTGAGVYLLYYHGDLPEYAAFRNANLGANPKIPIYIGKADRRGQRKGMSFLSTQGNELRNRLNDHRRSIEAAGNLSISDFRCRWLSIEDAFIGLAESVLVAVFDPLWNRVLDGFGNNPTGSPRSGQAVSKWDTFHPGRRRGQGAAGTELDSLRNQVADYFKRNPDELEERLTRIRSRIERYGLG